MTRAFPNWDQRAFPIPEGIRAFPSGGVSYVNPNADPYWDQVQCLFGFNGEDESVVGDESSVSPALANIGYLNQARVRTAESKFGGSALDLDGSGDRVQWDDHDGFSIGSADFTIECYMRKVDLSNGAFMAKYGATASEAEWFFNYNGTNLQFLYFYGTGNNSFDFVTQSWAVATGDWHHVAVDRVGDDFWLYFGGTMISSQNNPNRSIQNTTQLVRIGARNHPTPQYHKGQIDELRFTLGTGRYGGVDFTPSGPFPRF